MERNLELNTELQKGLFWKTSPKASRKHLLQILQKKFNRKTYKYIKTLYINVLL